MEAIEMKTKITKTDAEWREQLTAEQYRITRKKGTEHAHTGEYAHNHDEGVYRCVGCGTELFSSDTKFESGTGWPSFYKPAAKTSVVEKRDPDGQRAEVICARCKGHLGHVFNDATGQYSIPKQPGGLRYCMNSGAMKFVKKK